MRCTSRFCPWPDSVCTLHSTILQFREMRFHFYADDTQLYISFTTNNDMELTNSIIKIEECLSDIDKWMSFYRLKLKAKTRPRFSTYSQSIIHNNLYHRFGTDRIKPSSHARNIGAIFDNSMSMLPYGNNVCKSAFYHFRTISRIKKILINANYKDYYSRLCNLQTFNSLLYNVPKDVIKKLQSVHKCSCQTDYTL